LSKSTPESAPTLVLGGGIVGLCTAYFLAKRGAGVRVVERDVIGAGASSGNAGIIAPGHPPLPRPGLPRRLPKLLFDGGSPLYIRPRIDPALVRWTIEFLWACRRSRYTRSIELLSRLGWEAASCMHNLIESEGLSCEYKRRGWLEVFLDSSTMAECRRTADSLRRLGYSVMELNGDQLRQREPAYRKDVVGALHYRDSSFADPGRFIAALAERVAGYGVEIRAETEVRRLVVSGGSCRGVELREGTIIEAPRVVLAAGAWTSALAKDAGVPLPMQAGKGYHMDLIRTAARPSTASVLAETFVAVTPLGAGLRLAGTVELGGLDLAMNTERLARLRQGAAEYIRGLDEAVVKSTWCGLRPMTADGLPIVGWAPGVRGLFVATGHAMMGFLLGPLTGRLAAEMILDRDCSVDIAALSPGRFGNMGLGSDV
jgi:D-amino-acid dehydrogenase